MNSTDTKTRNKISIVIACAALALCAVVLANAQERGKNDEDEGFKNLKVLSPDIERRELIGMMRGFSGALGVRCVHCHVGDDAQGLSSFDFAADDKPAKLKARVMMQMVEAINNTHLTQLGEDNPRTVDCNTCHHGLPEPTTLEEELAEVYDASGLDSALAVYQALRDEYYGGASYDFGEGALLRFAEHVTGAEDVDGTLKVLHLNMEHFPESAFSLFKLGEAYRQLDDTANALKYYKAAQEFLGDNPALQKRIEALEGK